MALLSVTVRFVKKVRVAKPLVLLLAGPVLLILLRLLTLLAFLVLGARGKVNRTETAGAFNAEKW